MEYVVFEMPLGHTRKVRLSIEAQERAIKNACAADQQILTDTLSILRAIKERAPKAKVEQRADNSRSHDAICPKCKSGRVFETAHWTWICCDCHFGW